MLMVWQFFVKNWIRKTATEKIRAAVEQELRNKGAAAASAAQSGEAAADQPQSRPEQPQSGPDQPQPRPEPVTAVILFADATAAGCLTDRLRGRMEIHGRGFRAHEGILARRRVIAARVESTEEDVLASATNALVDAHRPAWVITADYGIALDAQAAQGDIVMANRVENGQAAGLDLNLKIDPAELAKTPGVHLGGLLSLPQFVGTPQERATLGEKHKALAAERIAYPVARACRERHIPLLAVTALLFGLDDQLPPEIANFQKQESIAGMLGAAAGAIVERPGSAMDYANLKQRNLTSGDRLAKYLEAMVGQFAARQE